MTAITVPEGVSFDAQPLMASMEDHTRASRRRESPPIRYRCRRWSSIHRNCLSRIAGRPNLTLAQRVSRIFVFAGRQDTNEVPMNRFERFSHAGGSHVARSEHLRARTLNLKDSAS